MKQRPEQEKVQASPPGPAEHSAAPRGAEERTRLVRTMIAKLVSTAIGALIGFVVASIINSVFTSDFREQKRDAEAQLKQAIQSSEALSPEWERVNSDLREVNSKLSTFPGLLEELEMEDLSLEDSGPQVPSPATTELQKLRQQRSSLMDDRRRIEAQQDQYEREITFANRQIPEAQKQITVLEISSWVVVIIFTLLGFIAYPLTQSLVERSSRTLQMLQEQPDGSAGQGVAGFFSGVLVGLLLLLTVFEAFGGENGMLSAPAFRILFGAFVVLLLGFTGAVVGVVYFGPSRRQDPYIAYRRTVPPRLLDTSVVIDGRIHDVAVFGFLGGLLIVTHSVLRELQALSDSSDERKRLKGRRGLELLRKMQENPLIELETFDDSFLDNQAKGTDEQLILLAEEMGAEVVTNDSNLIRVATLRQVRVLNMHSLATAVKVNHVPGDYIELSIADRGKQHGQGVGYLEDGTMVVVEDGEPYIGQIRSVRLTSVSQTVQGRLLFGRVDAAEQHGGRNGH